MNKKMESNDQRTFCQYLYFGLLENNMRFLYVKRCIMCYVFVENMTAITLIKVMKRNEVIILYSRILFLF